MSNVKHAKCPIRNLAKTAKSRLANNDYDQDEINAPKNLTPQQKDIYLKLVKLARSGEEISDPISRFADEKKLCTLSREEKQRYVLSLCADYVQIKQYISRKSQYPIEQTNTI